ncbi:MAG TPA: four helix bundle protein [Candidatus Woesebacteria bacterium]|nr:four helix bundle protein [Candidatus Woesebacteria bacterium]
MVIKEFTDLYAWQKGHQLVLEIYKLTKKFPTNEMYGLCDQLKRASVSITSNIAEGFGRQGIKEKIQFYYLANGSTTEVKNQLLIARDVGYISPTDFTKIENLLLDTHHLLLALISKTKSFYHN